MFGRILVVVVLSLFLWATFARSSDASGAESSYVVRPADTLWSIAARSYGDPREGVYELRERNRLQGTTVVPGQVLVIPG
jgi:nucleoid-associated protein YgaU